MTASSPRSSAPPSVGLDERAEDHLRARLASAAIEAPMLPEVAATVIRESEEDIDFKSVSEQIHKDQALAGHVLRIANSAAFSGRSGRISSLQQALVRLGIRRVKELVLAVVMKTRIFRSRRHALKAQTTWREAAASACLAREIARQMHKSSESAFLCGLLHTVGKPVVLDLLSEFETRERLGLPEEVVDRLLAEYYVPAGRRLVSTWSLPDIVETSISFHQHPELSPAHVILVTTVAAAGGLAPRILARESIVTLTKHPLFESLHLYQDDVLQILAHRDAIRLYVEAIG